MKSSNNSNHDHLQIDMAEDTNGSHYSIQLSSDEHETTEDLESFTSDHGKLRIF